MGRLDGGDVRAAAAAGRRAAGAEPRAIPARCGLPRDSTRHQRKGRGARAGAGGRGGASQARRRGWRGRWGGPRSQARAWAACRGGGRGGGQGGRTAGVAQEAAAAGGLARCRGVCWFRRRDGQAAAQDDRSGRALRGVRGRRGRRRDHAFRRGGRAGGALRCGRRQNCRHTQGPQGRRLGGCPVRGCRRRLHGRRGRHAPAVGGNGQGR
mmetsp:Transcript_1009/g.2890  ORF Transcript_1009/g.2890 Transcript_1009/m.2890 type:complete len:210 (+) Transcript_1009:288-917(+)